MSKVIETLTPEQEARIPEYLERFRAYGLSTEPCNKEEAEKAFIELAQRDGKGTPTFIWVDSPLQAAVASAVLEKNGQEKVIELISNNGLLDQKLINDNIEAIRSVPSFASYGSFEAYWVSFYAFVGQVLPTEHDGLVDIVERIVKNTGFYVSYENLYIISEKPVFMSFDEENRLHNEHKPALLYKDNTGVCAINGTRLPMFLFNTPKDQVDPGKVLKIANTSTRLAAMKFLGMDKFLAALGYKVLDVSTTEKGLELIEVVLEGQPNKFMKMVNPSTGEIHVEKVPTEVRSVTEADSFRQGKSVLDKYGYQAPLAKA